MSETPAKKTPSAKPAKSLKARLKMAIAGLALVGVLAGGAAAVSNDAPAAEDTTETARSYFFTSYRSATWR